MNVTTNTMTITGTTSAGTSTASYVIPPTYSEPTYDMELEVKRRVRIEIMEYKRRQRLKDDKVGKIEKVIFNDPATIIFWKYGGKTVVKCTEGDEYDKKTGFELCYLKAVLTTAQYRKYSDYFFYDGRKGERFVDLLAKEKMGGYEKYKKTIREWVK